MQVLQPNLGAVMGYGVALQASCLEGFDSLGLHQVSKVFIQQITKIQLLLENKTNTDLLCLVHIMAIMIGCLPVQRGSIPLRGARREGSSNDWAIDVEVVDFGASPIQI